MKNSILSRQLERNNIWPSLSPWFQPWGLSLYPNQVSSVAKNIISITWFFTRKKNCHIVNISYLVFFEVQVLPVSFRSLDQCDDHPRRFDQQLAFLWYYLIVQFLYSTSVVLPLDIMEFYIKGCRFELRLNLTLLNPLQWYIYLQQETREKIWSSMCVLDVDKIITATGN